MTLQRMDNVLIVVDDLEAAKAFFVELGMELEGGMPVEGRWVDLIVGLENVRCEIAMMRTPDGHGRLELTKFHAPAAVRAEPKNAPVNTLGLRRIMFAVDDIEDVLARLRAHGAELVGEVAQYEDMYRLCYRFCRKFSLEAICGMISLHDQRSIMREQDDGDQFQRGPFPPRSHSHGCPLVCGVPAEHAPCGRTHGGTRGGGRSLHHQPVGHQI